MRLRKLSLLFPGGVALSLVILASCASSSPSSPSLGAAPPPRLAAPSESAVVVPKPSASYRSPVSPPERVVPAGCSTEISATDAEKDFADAQGFIERAGEHPSDHDLNEILPRLKRAALSGHLNAQARYGHYVVGYWLTDEMFWPKDRSTAVSALAMLRVAVRRGHPSAQASWHGLGSSPPVRDSEVFKILPAAWLLVAVSEADAWERCHPSP